MSSHINYLLINVTVNQTSVHICWQQLKQKLYTLHLPWIMRKTILAAYHDAQSTIDRNYTGSLALVSFPVGHWNSA